tara:strand:+ start:634 stop:1026 length:393 start_codon:yes stop_codon:yes gene_type:complete
MKATGAGAISKLLEDKGETMGITITEKAAAEASRALEETSQAIDGHVLRVGVSGGGCGGFQYRLAWDDKVDETADDVSTQHGVRIAVDRKSMLYLDGVVIDWHDGLEQRGFRFDNPNAQQSCGCGTSFSC